MTHNKIVERIVKLQEIADRLPEYKEFVEQLYDDLAMAETDAVYWEMKYRGTWPEDTNIGDTDDN